MKKPLKWLGIALAAIVCVVVLGVSGMFAATSVKMKRDYTVDAALLTLAPPNPPSLERGRHLSEAVAKCSACHGADLGGAVVEDDPAFGRFVASNLTTGEGGVGAQYRTDADWVRALRHGIAPDGRSLIFMPAQEYRHLSEQDLADIVAYVRSMPPVDRTLASTKPGPIARMLYLAGAFPLVPAEQIDHTASPPAPPAEGETIAYGEYLSKVGGCIGCHGPNLDGKNGQPGVPNLRSDSLATWTEADYFRVLREGKRPDGRVLSTDMPWTYTAKMTDLETRATAKYLATLPGTQ